jgi:hypothetical protein
MNLSFDLDFVTGLCHAGDLTYDAMFSFSYVISAYNLIPGRPTQTNKIGSPACGGFVLSYDSTSVGQEADAVYPGSPGGYARIRGGSQTTYRAFMNVASPISGATMAAHVRVRSGWVQSHFMSIMFPATSSTQLQWMVLATDLSTPHCVICSVQSCYAEYFNYLPVNIWHTYACTYDTTSDILAAYFDGALVGTETAIATSTSTTSLSGVSGHMYMADDTDSYIDFKAAYLFSSGKTASQIEELHNMMIFDGTPRAFPS